LFRKIVKEIKKKTFFLPCVVYHLYIKSGKRDFQVYIEEGLHKPENHGKWTINYRD